jgi:putative FmdB family regulatory protein
MPLFEFRCRTCGHCFEMLVFATTRSPVVCPSCDASDLEKLYSVFGVGGGAKAAQPHAVTGAT